MTGFCACAIVGHLWIVPEANSVSTRADFSSGLQKLRSGCAAQPADVLAVLSAGSPGEQEALRQAAEDTLLHHCGADVQLRGLIEFSNVCACDCLYCGIRKGNRQLPRYTLTRGQVAVNDGKVETQEGHGEFVARKGIYPNLDYPSGPAYNLMGFDTLTFTPLFVAALQAGQTTSPILLDQYQGRLSLSVSVRAYGAGILSSAGELEYCVKSPEPHRLPLDLQRAMRTLYKIDTYQQTYFVLDDMQQLLDFASTDFAPLYAQLRQQPTIGAKELLPGETLLKI